MSPFSSGFYSSFSVFHLPLGPQRLLTQKHTSSIRLHSFKILSTKPKLSKISKLRHCRPSAWPLKTLVPRLSMIRVSMPQRAAHVASISLPYVSHLRWNHEYLSHPAGPAPTMSRSQCPSCREPIMSIQNIQEENYMNVE